MSDYAVALQVDDGLASAGQVDWRTLQDAISATLRSQDVAPGASVSLVIVDDLEMARLNDAHRGALGPTDVLSFATGEGGALILPPDAPLELGDIVISLPTAARQAATEGNPLTHELVLLAVHGCLHLLGYDHLAASEKNEMWPVQRVILDSLGVIIQI